MFNDRKEAGEELGKALKKYKSSNPILLGIPRGGVKVGYYAALELDCDFDVIVVRKLGYPHQPEAAFGAIAEDGSLYLNPWSNEYLNKQIIEGVIENEQSEIERRIRKYRGGRPLDSLKNRTVILIDDGIASGATVFAAMHMCKKQKPRKLVIAAPISGKDKVSLFRAKADEVVILEQWENFFAVSQGYKNFANMNDTQVLHYLDLWQQHNTEETPPKS